MKKRVELLAPAGSYEAFTGALNAGADAVYLEQGPMRIIFRRKKSAVRSATPIF